MVRTGISPEWVNLARCVNNHTSEISFRITHSGRYTGADDGLQTRRNILYYIVETSCIVAWIHYNNMWVYADDSSWVSGDSRYYIIIILGISIVEDATRPRHVFVAYYYDQLITIFFYRYRYDDMLHIIFIRVGTIIN